MTKSLMRRIENDLTTGYDYHVVKRGVEAWLYGHMEGLAVGGERETMIRQLLADIDKPILSRSA